MKICQLLASTDDEKTVRHDANLSTYLYRIREATIKALKATGKKVLKKKFLPLYLYLLIFLPL